MEIEKLEKTVLSRRQAVTGLGLFGLFLTAPTLFGSDKAEAKAIDSAAESLARQESKARDQDKVDEVEVAQADDGTATDFSSQYYRRRRRRRRFYRRRYLVVRRRYWPRRYWRRRRFW